MKKKIFINLYFKQILISLIISLFFYNIIVSLITKNIFGYIPVTIEIFLLGMIFVKSRYIKSAIILWSIVLIVSFGSAFLANLMDNIGKNSFTESQILNLVLNVIAVAIGIVVIDYSRRTLKLETLNKE